ncbi:hypothetical protein [Sphingobacterium faecium]|nr:hypothetical protein [Sphingobacterium faecium]
MLKVLDRVLWIEALSIHGLLRADGLFKTEKGEVYVFSSPFSVVLECNTL